MSDYVPVGLRRLVQERADGRCEYCLIREDDCLLPHEPDHIIATKHRGETSEANLAWTCFICNRAKGSDVASVDDKTGEIVRLFSPRSDSWSEHFELSENGRIVPQTAVARATVALLKINRPEQVELRNTLIQIGLYPPEPNRRDES